MTEEQRLKCLCFLADDEIRELKKRNLHVDQVVAHLLLKGNRIGTPYSRLHSDELCKTIYYECEHDMESYDEWGVIEWVMKQETNDWFKP